MNDLTVFFCLFKSGSSEQEDCSCALCAGDFLLTGVPEGQSGIFTESSAFYSRGECPFNKRWIDFYDVRSDLYSFHKAMIYPCSLKRLYIYSAS